MKLRLFRNEVRLRLSADEVSGLVETGRAEGRTVLDSSGAGLRYAVTLQGDGEGTELCFQDALLTVTLPRTLAEPWLTGKQQGITETVNTGSGPVELTVETDKQRY